MNMYDESSLCGMSDEDVTALARAGNKHALNHIIARYRNCVYGTANTYFLAGAEKDDVVQEGMIGLYKAVKEYTPGVSSFAHFAKMCISRQIISAVKSASRKKHVPLNSYLSLDKDDCDADAMLPEDNEHNPESIVINKESLCSTERKINDGLSKLELQVFMYYTDGLSYDEIAEILGKPVKSVDNAMQRIRKKLSALLTEK